MESAIDAEKEYGEGAEREWTWWRRGVEGETRAVPIELGMGGARGYCGAWDSER